MGKRRRRSGRSRKPFLFGGGLAAVVGLAVLAVALLVFVGLNKEPQNESDVMEIINSHPREEIRRGLSLLVQQGKVQVRFDPNLPRQRPMKINIGELQDGTRIIVLFHGPGRLRFTPQQQWALLIHEYQHIKELIDGTVIVQDVSSLGLVQKTQNAINTYEQEVRAYSAQCIFENEIRVSTGHPACLEFPKMDMLGFRLWLAGYLVGTEEQFRNYGESLLRQAVSRP